MFSTLSLAGPAAEDGRRHGNEEPSPAADPEPVQKGCASGRPRQPQGAGLAQGQVTTQPAIWPTIDDVADALIPALQGIHGTAFHIVDPGLLESALALPHQAYYETFWDKLAAMVRSIAANHALADGNKRLAFTALHATLCVNRYLWLWSQEDGERVILRIAEGDTSFEWLATFLRVWHLPMRLDIAAEYAVSTDIPTLIAIVERVRKHAASEVRVAGTLYQHIAAHARGDLDPDQIERMERILSSRVSLWLSG